MSGAPPKDSDVWKALKKKAPGKALQRGPHDKLALEVDGYFLGSISVPRHNEELARGTYNSICSQARLSRSQMAALVKCTMSRNDYVKHLRENEIPKD